MSQLTDDAREWLELQTKEFMKPYAIEATEPDDIGFEPSNDEFEPGWYSRLSAPGYMDCTDWSGPYKTQNDAFTALYDMFGQ